MAPIGSRVWLASGRSSPTAHGVPPARRSRRPPRPAHGTNDARCGAGRPSFGVLSRFASRAPRLAVLGRSPGSLWLVLGRLSLRLCSPRGGGTPASCGEGEREECVASLAIGCGDDAPPLYRGGRPGWTALCGRNGGRLPAGTAAPTATSRRRPVSARLFSGAAAFDLVAPGAVELVLRPKSSSPPGSNRSSRAVKQRSP